jgi:hypothetical protein
MHVSTVKHAAKNSRFGLDQQVTVAASGVMPSQLLPTVMICVCAAQSVPLNTLVCLRGEESDYMWV